MIFVGQGTAPLFVKNSLEHANTLSNSVKSRVYSPSFRIRRLFIPMASPMSAYINQHASLTYDSLHELSKAELILAISPTMTTLSRAEKRDKDILIRGILDRGSRDTFSSLWNTLETKRTTKEIRRREKVVKQPAQSGSSAVSPDTEPESSAASLLASDTMGLPQIPASFSNSVSLSSSSLGSLPEHTPSTVSSLPPLSFDYIQMLTKSVIMTCVSPHMALSRSERDRKDTLIDAVLSRAPSECRVQLQELIRAKQASLEEKSGARKRKHAEDDSERYRSRRRIEDGDDESDSDEPHDLARFLQLPTAKRIRECHRQFYERTSNAALAMETCAVCAQELNQQESAITHLPLSDIPNLHRLSPKIPHPAHTLYSAAGALLEPSAVHNVDGQDIAAVCSSCLAALKEKSEKDLPPKFSLANNLWMGAVPWELAVLTISEQLLIAHIYPRVYVFKMFPKRWHGKRDGENVNLQRGMRGTVSSYALNMDHITAMLDGNMMPRRPEILASVISVTFLGLGSLPESWLKKTFRVRRGHITAALRWLRKNNPKYYGHIQISEEVLQSLPEDDVPQEIMTIIRHSPDASIVDAEAAGYVPDADQEATHEGMC